MATQTAARGAKAPVNDALYLWQAQDRKGQALRGQGLDESAPTP